MSVNLNQAQIVNQILSGNNRQSLYHNTYLENVASMAHFDAMYSCQYVMPSLSNQRRASSIRTQYQGKLYIANDQLEIDSRMMSPGVTKEDFRKLLDEHVFFWATRADCKKMFNRYVRIQPTIKRVVFQFNASKLISNNFNNISLCKYNSGSNPLNIHTCSYRKGPNIYLPASQFGSVVRNDVPVFSNQIREVHLKDKLDNMTAYIEKIYAQNKSDLPTQWQPFFEPISNF